MATVEKRPATAATNGDRGGEIPVDNPATGEVIASVPNRSAQDVKAMVARARAAQPGWEALGFEGRARVFLRAQKWVLDNADRIIDTIISETGKTVEDAQGAEISYAANAFGSSKPPVSRSQLMASRESLLAKACTRTFGMSQLPRPLR